MCTEKHELSVPHFLRNPRVLYCRRLDSNPFICDCGLQWLAKIVKESSIQATASCDQPSHWQGQDLTEVDLSRLDCSTYSAVSDRHLTSGQLDSTSSSDNYIPDSNTDSVLRPDQNRPSQGRCGMSGLQLRMFWHVTIGRVAVLVVCNAKNVLLPCF